MTHVASHHDTQIDYHIKWGFRSDAVVWTDGRATRPNFYPVASELSNWMVRRGNLSIYTDEHRAELGALTNPYTYHASTITTIIGQIINSAQDFCESVDELEPRYIEIERIRLYNEYALYFARFYEVAIKQLLFLTTFSTRRYRNVALGGLLSVDCYACRKSGTTHRISLLGSLAHSYRICFEFDDCGIATIKAINKLRNEESAHASTQRIYARPAAETRHQLKEDTYNLGSTFLHSLTHLAKLEHAIESDLYKKILAGAGRA